MTGSESASTAGGRAASDSENPIFWEPSLAYLKLSCAILFVGAICFMLVVRVLAPDQTARYVASAVAGTVALAAWFLVSQGRVKAAVYTLAIGAWIVITGVSFFFGGVRAPIIYAYPISIVLFGWLVSTRLALWLAGLSAAIIVGFVAGESSGVLPTQPQTPAALHGVMQILVMALSAALIYFLVRAYKNRNAELVALGNVLALRSSELESSSRELKRAQTVAKVGSWVFDIGSGRMHLSDETCHIFGVPAGTVGTHDSYLAKVHAQDRNDVERAWQAALRGAGFDHQHRVLNRDRTAWIHQSAELEFAPDGTALRAMGVVQDITEQKLAEQALRASEEKFAKVFLSSPMLVSISTRDEGRYIDVNDAFLHLLGHTREQVIGKTSRDIGIWKNPQDRQRAIDGLSSQQGANGTEVELCKRSGETVVCEVRGAPIDIDGTPCLIMVTHDITDRKKAEAALQESETRYRALVEWSPEPTLVHGGGRILYANPACIALFGASSAEELVGTPVIEVVHPDYRVFALARVKAMTETGINVPMVEELLVRRDGTPFEAEVQAKPIQYDGKPAIHIAMHDVSRRKREEAARLLLEAQLRESQKMQAIGTLAGGIAHDFNNIIATILGNAELAHQDAGANAAVQESLDEIRKAGARARDLVRQILSFSRREPPERRRIDLPPVIEESVRLLRATLPARVSLSVHCDPGVPPVLADRTQIEQVLINLATNAAQAMRDAPGHIDIHLNTVLLDATLARSHPALHALHEERPGRMVRIAVRDDGPGMDAATLGRIFEPFFTTKPVGEGTGLGLSVVHGIVQAHEGAILVESQPGRGTEFTVYLPVAGVA